MKDVGCSSPAGFVLEPEFRSTSSLARSEVLMVEHDPPSPVAGGSAFDDDHHATAERDPSKTRLAVWLPILISASVAFGGSVSWLYSIHTASVKQQIDDANAKLKETTDATKAKANLNEQLLKTYLLPIQLKLEVSLSLYNQLSEQYLVPGYGILESYVKMAREQGSEKVALQYGLITELVAIDSQI